jgi:hypothetical protein
MRVVFIDCGLPLPVTNTRRSYQSVGPKSTKKKALSIGSVRDCLPQHEAPCVSWGPLRLPGKAPGKSEDQKTRLADKIAKDVMDVFNYGEESVSVGFDEIKSRD